MKFGEPGQAKSLGFQFVLRASSIAILLASTGCTHKVPVPEPRNMSVLFITLDTTRADHLSCYAGETVSKVQPPARTPHLDALAARGIRFAHATAEVPLTLPSHACMFTGTYPEVHQLRDMGGFTLDRKHLTLASMARDEGYRTAAFVSSKAVGRAFGLQQGFDTYDDQMPSGEQQEGQLPGVFPQRRGEVTAEHALTWLRQHGHERFFLWIHFYDPHWPYDPPEPYKSQYSGDPYSGAIAYMDAQVGRILDFLAQEKLQDRTLIIAAGDHGEGLNDHGEATHGVFIYDDTLHVPLIIAGPGVPSGKVVSDQVRLIDLLPTVADFLNLAPNPAVQGVSLWPLIEGRRPLPGKGSNYAYIETLYPKTYMNWSELRGMRTDRWKFILAPQPELYDLERDPGERENVIAQHPAEAGQLQKKIWEVIGPPTQDQKLTYSPVSPETRQELESLGYVSAGRSEEVILNGSGPDPKSRLSIMRAMEEYDRLMNARAFARAARTMEVAVKNDPGNPLLRRYLATVYEQTGDWQRAIKTCQDAVELHAATSDILSLLARGYVRVHDFDNAVKVMEEAARLDPTDLDNFCNLGTAYLNLKRLPEAEKAFRATLILDDHFAKAYNGLGLIAAQRGDGDNARANFEKALEYDPEQFEAMLNLGVLYQQTGQKELALRYLKMFSEKAPPEDYGQVLPQVREAIRDFQ